MYTVEGCPPSDHYTIAQIGGSIVPGTTDIGNHGDDTVTTIALPFSYTLYDQTFTSINLSSNGNAQFTTTDTTFTNQCLPWTTHNYTIYPYWDDLYLVNSGFGIFTSISGTAPNRIFNIEWRAQYFPGSGSANFELRLYEGQTRFDVIYGTVTNGNTSATAGVQKNDTAFDQYFCNGAGHACYWRAKLHPDTVQSVTNAYGIAKRDGNCYRDCDRHGYTATARRQRQLLRQRQLPQPRRPLRLLPPQRLLRRRGLLSSPRPRPTPPAPTVRLADRLISN